MSHGAAVGEIAGEAAIPGAVQASQQAPCSQPKKPKPDSWS